MNSINFFVEDIDFSLKEKLKIKKWVSNTIKSEHKQIGNINYIFCSDDYLLKINIKHLKHDTYTDIITFNYCTENTINSDIYISIERVTENAKTFSKGFENELKRVIIHGILHLLGYNDKTKEEKAIMRSKEDFYLPLFHQ